jgi:hypothetical protein
LTQYKKYTTPEEVVIYHKFCKKVTKKEIELVTQKISEYEDAIFQMSNQFVLKQA